MKIQQERMAEFERDLEGRFLKFREGLLAGGYTIKDDCTVGEAIELARLSARWARGVCIEEAKPLVEALEAYANAEDVQCRTRYLDSNGQEQLDEWDQDLARKALADWKGEE